jgi:hypothetical protein
VVTREAQDVFKDRPDVEPQLGHSLSADLTRLLKAAWQSPRYDLGPWRGHPDARRTSEPKREEK